ncbi:b42.3 [miniopterid betaherpesvirus 1]|uniref:B42.3 n=1 Tax=miniopterid betaherpesvirus 1 TaxID=3070189 RepID=I3VQ26_9BETA|nr:b42.3 [miniopterid betaherpesvirus 1]AFK83870.1 b42.3 [miniopterid betaherpesvirus 1]
MPRRRCRRRFRDSRCPRVSWRVFGMCKKARIKRNVFSTKSGLCLLLGGGGGFLSALLHVRMFEFDRVPGRGNEGGNGGTVAAILCMLLLSYLIYDDCCKILAAAGYDCFQ